MKRLTEWADNAKKIDSFSNRDFASRYATNDNEAAIGKLGKSEDIEDRSKIGVSVMFEATKNGIFSAYLCEESGGYIPPRDLVIWEGQLYRKPMGQPFHTDMFPLWKYGEDWALTKEELRGKNDADQRD